MELQISWQELEQYLKERRLIAMAALATCDPQQSGKVGRCQGVLADIELMLRLPEELRARREPPTRKDSQ